QAGTVESEEIGEAAGSEAQTVARQGVRVDAVQRRTASVKLEVLAVADAHEHARAAAGEAIGRQPAVLQCLPPHLQQQSLLWVRARSSACRRACSLSRARSACFKGDSDGECSDIRGLTYGVQGCEPLGEERFGLGLGEPGNLFGQYGFFSCGRLTALPFVFLP